MEQKEIILNRLKTAYKKYKSANNESLEYSFGVVYRIERVFCLDCSLLSFAEIEEMEYNVNQENN